MHGFITSRRHWVIEYAKPGVNLAWLEKGNVNAGLTHIIFRHAGEFAAAGLRIEDIPALVSKALTEGTRVGPRGGKADLRGRLQRQDPARGR
ncbi:hypothetical protein [Streptomyces sp. HUCO-GS316]|uniref:hypothetical protein n=1 Tax=Streptomyces sp. HUCO-GS316 TaxID=2692198 RepID=UPI001F3F9C37|nr:hypothetical protein [Streptomyces sp. HUCO-GS316]